MPLKIGILYNIAPVSVLDIPLNIGNLDNKIKINIKKSPTKKDTPLITILPNLCDLVFTSTLYNEKVTADKTASPIPCKSEILNFKFNGFKIQAIPTKLILIEIILLLFNFSFKIKQANGIVKTGFVLNKIATIDALV
ncbi:hypothetical protein GCM10008909_19500 [Hathewaya limosa]